MRSKMNVSLDGEFSDSFTEQVNRRYHAQFKDTRLYANTLAITLLYKGLDSGKVGKTLNLIERLSQKALRQARAASRANALGELDKAVQQFVTTMQVFQPHLVGSQDAQLGYCELLQFYAMLLNGGQRTRFAFPANVPPMTNGVSDAAKAQRRYPEGNIAPYLVASRPFLWALY